MNSSEDHGGYTGENVHANCADKEGKVNEEVRTQYPWRRSARGGIAMVRIELGWT